MSSQATLVAGARLAARRAPRQRARHRAHNRAPDRLVFAGLLALVVWVPFPEGSKGPAGLLTLETAVFALGFLWLLGCARGRLPVPQAFREARPALVLLALWVGWGALQLLPLPMPLLELLSPYAAGHYAALAGQGIELGAAPLSLDPAAGVEALRESAAYFVLFALVLLMVRHAGRLRWLGYVVVASGVLHAVIGVLAVLTGERPYAVSGFTNQNHFAAYLVLALCTGVGLMLADPVLAERRQDLRRRLRYLARLLLSEKVAIRLLLVALVVGVVLSASRGANLALAGALAAMGVVSLLARRGIDRRLLVLLVSMAVVDLLIVGAWFGVEKVRQEIAQTSAETEDRVPQNRQNWALFLEAPLTGTGAGSYASVFPAHRHESAGRHVYLNAHNDHLETALESGLVGYGLLGLLVLASVRRAWRLLAPERPPGDLALGLASIGVIAASLGQATVEFLLQTPAYAFTLVVLLALPWTRTLRPGEVAADHQFAGEGRE